MYIQQKNYRTKPVYTRTWSCGPVLILKAVLGITVVSAVSIAVFFRVTMQFSQIPQKVTKKLLQSNPILGLHTAVFQLVFKGRGAQLHLKGHL